MITGFVLGPLRHVDKGSGSHEKNLCGYKGPNPIYSHSKQVSITIFVVITWIVLKPEDLSRLLKSVPA